MRVFFGFFLTSIVCFVQSPEPIISLGIIKLTWIWMICINWLYKFVFDKFHNFGVLFEWFGDGFIFSLEFLSRNSAMSSGNVLGSGKFISETCCKLDFIQLYIKSANILVDPRIVPSMYFWYISGLFSGFRSSI